MRNFWMRCSFLFVMTVCLFAIRGTLVNAGPYVQETPISVTVDSASLPTSGKGWIAGSVHALTATASDKDKSLGDATHPDKIVDDDLTVWWTGSGTFRGNAYVGTSVIYICPPTQGSDLIRVYADDDDSANVDGGTNKALWNDTVKYQNQVISVYLPFLKEASYKAPSKGQISGIASPEYVHNVDDNSVAVKCEENAFKADATFGISAEVENADCVVNALTYSMLWSGWLDKYVSFSFGSSLETSSAEFSSVIHDPRIVDYATEGVFWNYTVTGSHGVWVSTTVQDFYVYFTYDKPLREEPELAYQYSCLWASGNPAGSGKESVCDAIRMGMHGHYVYAGTCLKEASNFVRLIGIQGVEGKIHYWRLWPLWTSNRLVLDGMKTIPIDLVGGPVAYTTPTWGNYHAWAEAESHQYDISTHNKEPGTWEDYEDFLFSDYQERSGTLHTNPSGQSWETSWDRGMSHFEASLDAFDATP